MFIVCREEVHFVAFIIMKVLSNQNGNKISTVSDTNWTIGIIPQRIGPNIIE